MEIKGEYQIAALPHVGSFLPARNVNSLVDLGRLLSDAPAAGRRVGA
jgi:hypothetical protein